jgi:peptidoglycan-associated lipoprotein
MTQLMTRLAAMALLAVMAACTTTADTAGSGAAAPGAGSNGPTVTAEENTEAYFIANVGDKVFFDTDSSSLDIAAQTTLTFQADWLLRYPDRTVIIEGHADERGTREYNLALGARRAQSTFDFLVGLGVDPARLTTVTYGKERPVSLCSNESCWSQNRRTVSVLAGGFNS